MINLTYACPNCAEASRIELAEKAQAFTCPRCEQQIRIPEGSLSGGNVERCLVCPSRDLYLRKDFPQRLGLAFVVLGLLASCIAWGYMRIYLTFGILLATALADVVLYAIVGDALKCYRCHAEYRNVNQPDEHGPFRLETHERYRQMDARQSETPPSETPPSETLHTEAWRSESQNLEALDSETLSAEARTSPAPSSADRPSATQTSADGI